MCKSLYKRDAKPHLAECIWFTCCTAISSIVQGCIRILQYTCSIHNCIITALVAKQSGSSLFLMQYKSKHLQPVLKIHAIVISLSCAVLLNWQDSPVASN